MFRLQQENLYRAINVNERPCDSLLSLQRLYCKSPHIYINIDEDPVIQDNVNVASSRTYSLDYLFSINNLFGNQHFKQCWRPINPIPYNKEMPMQCKMQTKVYLLKGLI